MIIIIRLLSLLNFKIGDWGLGIGDWAQSPIPNPQSPNHITLYLIKVIFYILIFELI